MTACHGMPVVAALMAAALCGAAQRADDKPKSPAGAAQKDYAAELPRFPLKSPAEAHKAFESGPASMSSWSPPSRCCAARSPSTSTRTAGSTSPSSPSTTSTPTAKPRRQRAASACWKTPTATASTTRAPSSPTTCRWRRPSPAGTAASTSGSAPDLLYLKDTDGDGKADVRRVVFTGFGTDRPARGCSTRSAGASTTASTSRPASTAATFAAATGRARRRSRSAAMASSSTRAARRSS